MSNQNDSQRRRRPAAAWMLTGTRLCPGRPVESRSERETRMPASGRAHDTQLHRSITRSRAIEHPSQRHRSPDPKPRTKLTCHPDARSLAHGSSTDRVREGDHLAAPCCRPRSEARKRRQGLRLVPVRLVEGRAGRARAGSAVGDQELPASHDQAGSAGHCDNRLPSPALAAARLVARPGVEVARDLGEAKRNQADQYVGQPDPSRPKWIRVPSFLMVWARPWATSRWPIARAAARPGPAGIPESARPEAWTFRSFRPSS